MIGIPSKSIASIAAVSPLATGYDDVNSLLNGEPSDIVKAGVTTGLVLDITMTPGQLHNAIMVVNCNADLASLRVFSDTNDLLYNPTKNFYTISALADLFPGQLRSKEMGKIIFYDSAKTSVSGGWVRVTLTHSGSEDEWCGEVWAGMAYDIGGRNPSWGLNRTPVYHSSGIPRVDGTRKKVDWATVHAYSGSVSAIHDRDSTRVIKAIAEEHGINPLPWRVTDLDGCEWDVFGRIECTTAYDRYGKEVLDFTITEEVAYNPGGSSAADVKFDGDEVFDGQKMFS